LIVALDQAKGLSHPQLELLQEMSRAIRSLLTNLQVEELD
jgi:hypothetical protein